MSDQKQNQGSAKWFNIVILSLSAGFLIIGVHQTITMGFEVSYWLFMLSVSLLLLNWMVKNTGNEKPKKSKKDDKGQIRSEKKKRRKATDANMNRRAKRYMNKIK